METSPNSAFKSIICTSSQPMLQNHQSCQNLLCQPHQQYNYLVSNRISLLLVPSQSCLSKLLPFFFSTSEKQLCSSSFTPSSKANLFASIFASNLYDQESQPPLYPTSSLTMSPNKFSTRKVRKALLQLNTSKSNGFVGIPAIVLKSCSPELVPVLNKLFQLSYNLGIFPSSWKLAHVFPLPEKVTNLTLQTIALLQSLPSSLRLWGPLSPNNCLPSLKQTTFFLTISMGSDKPNLSGTF